MHVIEKISHQMRAHNNITTRQGQARWWERWREWEKRHQHSRKTTPELHILWFNAFATFHYNKNVMIYRGCEKGDGAHAVKRESFWQKNVSENNCDFAEHQWISIRRSVAAFVWWLFSRSHTPKSGRKVFFWKRSQRATGKAERKGKRFLNVSGWVADVVRCC